MHSVSELEADIYPSEEALVLGWRISELCRMGFPENEAEGIASYDFDLHELERLLESGAPLYTALQIVLP